MALSAAAAAGGSAPFPGADQMDHDGGSHRRKDEGREEGPSVGAEKVKHKNLLIWMHC